MQTLGRRGNGSTLSGEIQCRNQALGSQFHATDIGRYPMNLHDSNSLPLERLQTLSSLVVAMTLLPAREASQRFECGEFQ